MAKSGEGEAEPVDRLGIRQREEIKAGNKPTAITAIVFSEMISTDMRPRAKAMNMARVMPIAAIAW